MRTNAYVVITALWITSFVQPTHDVIWFAHHHPSPPLSEPEPFSAFAAAANAVAVLKPLPARAGIRGLQLGKCAPCKAVLQVVRSQ